MAKKVLSDEEILKKIQKNPSYIQKVEYTLERAIAAVGKKGEALQYIPSPRKGKQICALAVEQNPLALEFVPPRYKTEALCMQAIQRDWRAFQFVPASMYSAAANVNDARRAKRLPGHQCFGLLSLAATHQFCHILSICILRHTNTNKLFSEIIKLNCIVGDVYL